MPIVATELKYYETTNDGLGGDISSNEIVSAELHNLFGPISSNDAEFGAVEYICLYVRNTNGVLTLNDAIIQLVENTPLNDTVIGIGLGTSAIDGSEQVIADKYTAPIGVTFTEVIDTPLNIGNLEANQYKSVWFRRTVAAGAPATTGDYFITQFKGDTVA